MEDGKVSRLGHGTHTDGFFIAFNCFFILLLLVELVSLLLDGLGSLQRTL